MGVMARGRRAKFRNAILLDVVGPLALFYGLRLAGVNQWVALVVSAAVPLVRLVYMIVVESRIERMTLFSLSIVVVSVSVSLLTGDPRLLLARESYFTALVGLWITSTLLAQRPLIYQATVELMPDDKAREWQEAWRSDAGFRRVMRVMTAAWGAAFVIDAVARVVMAYTLPVDSVPVLSAALLVVMLVAVVQMSKVYGRRQLTRDRHQVTRDRHQGTRDRHQVTRDG